MSAQRILQGIRHTNLQIIDNQLNNTGTSRKSGSTHGLYVQAQDFVIEGNRISGGRDGNGISVQSSGAVACNEISGTSASEKGGIR
jgi:hypothetical protein